MNRSLDKGLYALQQAFTKGDLVKHDYKNNEAIGVISENGYIIWNGKHYSSISTFATNHKRTITGRPISANGWDECCWKKPNDTLWSYTFDKRKD